MDWLFNLLVSDWWLFLVRICFHWLIISGLQEKDQMMIFQILSALLHFGNVQIKEKDAESSEIPVSKYI